MAMVIKDSSILMDGNYSNNNGIKMQNSNLSSMNMVNIDEDELI